MSTRLDDISGLIISCILASVGIFACITTFMSVRAAHKAIAKTTTKWIRVRSAIDPHMVLPAVKGAGSSGEIAREGAYSSIQLPVGVGISWLLIIVVVLLSFRCELSTYKSLHVHLFNGPSVCPPTPFWIDSILEIFPHSHI